jgi:hypothetical protein
MIRDTTGLSFNRGLRGLLVRVGTIAQGVGWSDPPPTPRTSASVVTDLHDLLMRAAVSPPYVIVGASARNAGNVRDRPLIVLTAGYWAPPGFEKQAADYHDVWVHELQAGLARLSTRRKQVVLDAGHDMVEAPDAVP